MDRYIGYGYRYRSTLFIISVIDTTANPTVITAAGGGNVPGPVPQHPAVTERQRTPQEVTIRAGRTEADRGGGETGTRKRSWAQSERHRIQMKIRRVNVNPNLSEEVERTRVVAFKDLIAGIDSGSITEDNYTGLNF